MVFFNNKNKCDSAGTDLPHPFSLAVFRDKLYWTDWKSATINDANKDDGSNRHVIRY